MKLLVDVGNSRVKWMATERGAIQARGAFAHAGHDPAGWGDWLWRALPPPALMVVASVAGDAVEAALKDWALRVWGLQAYFARSEAQAFGIVNGYDNPRQLGVDRWVKLIAARSLGQRDYVVVSAGTAVTLNALRRDGRFLGGVILPGIELMSQALFRNTQQIGYASAGETTTVLATNTRDAVWSGAIRAWPRPSTGSRATWRKSWTAECKESLPAAPLPPYCPTSNTAIATNPI
ncbi:MAG: type III pantothenate kinase [Gammaproteobacteria bacterium]